MRTKFKFPETVLLLLKGKFLPISLRSTRAQCLIDATDSYKAEGMQGEMIGTHLAPTFSFGGVLVKPALGKPPEYDHCTFQILLSNKHLSISDHLATYPSRWVSWKINTYRPTYMQLLMSISVNAGSMVSIITLNNKRVFD